MDVPQSQIVQAAGAHLRRGDGAVGGTLAGRVCVEQADFPAFLSFGRKMLQKGRAVHALIACTVDFQIQLRKGNGFQSPPEDADILRPAFGDPWGGIADEIVVSGGDKYGNAAVCQPLFQSLDALPARVAVKEVACQQHQIAALLTGKLRQLSGKKPLLLPQKLPLLLREGGKGGIQVPIRAVKNRYSHSSTRSAFMVFPVTLSTVNSTALS